jgi:hypothetical protein
VCRGLYESLLTQRLRRELDRVQTSDQGVPVLARIDDAEQPEVLARHVRDATPSGAVLSSTRDLLRRVEIVNVLLDQLEAEDDDGLEDSRQLVSLTRPNTQAGRIGLDGTRHLRRCRMLHWLRNSHGEPTLGAELRAELDTGAPVRQHAGAG